MFKPMYARHVLVTICVFAVITVLCVGTSHFVEESARRHFFDEQATALINQIQTHVGDQEAYVQELNQANEKMHMPLSIDLLEANAEPAHGPPSLSVKIVTASGEKTLRVSMHPHGPPPPEFGHRPPGVRGPFMGPPPMFFGPSLVTIASLLFAILLASALSVFFIYRSFREKAEMAREVLGRMQRGDLKARFTISNRDEARQMFELFNQMAAEIERLVERLREDERTRVQLLQELAHDLRTPVSSLKNAIETIRFDEDKLDAATKAEIKDLAFQETEYLSRLVDDLLFLALVLEPKYKTESSEVTLSELISSQMLIRLTPERCLPDPCVHGAAGLSEDNEGVSRSIFFKRVVSRLSRSVSLA